MRLLVIDPLAESDGHLLEDDLFWATTLSGLVQRFQIITSERSHHLIKESGLGAFSKSFRWSGKSVFERTRSHHLKYMARVTMLARGYDAVMFQSFHELSALWFSYLNPHVPIYLIVTNNLTGQGTSSSKRILLQRILFNRVAGVFVGSHFEMNRIKQLFPSIDRKKISMIRYHKIGAEKIVHGLSERRNEIVFLGSPTKDRGIERFLDWAENASEDYKFVIYGRMPKDESINSRIAGTSNNVSVVDRYLDDQEYHQVIARALFVALPFLKSFEGRLSGVLADSISHGTPVIASKQEPHTDMFSRYGEFGYLVDANDTKLRLPKLNEIEPDWMRFQNAMANARADNSREAIANQVLQTVFAID